MYENKYVFKLTNYQIDNILTPFLTSKFSKMDSTHLPDFYYVNGVCKPNYYKKVCTRDLALKEELETFLGIKLSDDQELMSKIDQSCLIQ